MKLDFVTLSSVCRDAWPTALLRISRIRSSSLGRDKLMDSASQTCLTASCWVSRTCSTPYTTKYCSPMSEEPARSRYASRASSVSPMTSRALHSLFQVATSASRPTCRIGRLMNSLIRSSNSRIAMLRVNLKSTC